MPTRDIIVLFQIYKITNTFSRFYVIANSGVSKQKSIAMYKDFLQNPATSMPYNSTARENVCNPFSMHH